MTIESPKSPYRLEVSELNSGYFAMVMATGIVSIACYLLGFEWLAWIIFRINEVAYVILWILFLIRLLLYFPNFKSDVMNHGRGPGFFTIVAGSAVLGNQFVILEGNIFIASILWTVGLSVWLILIYSFMTFVTTQDQKPSLETGINGAWLVIVVSTQSISILGTLIAASYHAWQDVILFFTLCMYLLGCMFYILIISLIFYRFIFFKLNPEDMTPPYWINMGATAITTLAGATLILNESLFVFLGELSIFLKGFTLFFWVTGTWWIPLLFILGGWRHFYKRHPLTYHPLNWGMVFPLGMYTVCTFQFAAALGLDFLYIIPTYFVYIAITAWVISFLGLLKRLGTVAVFARRSRKMTE